MCVAYCCVVNVFFLSRDSLRGGIYLLLPLRCGEWFRCREGNNHENECWDTRGKHIYCGALARDSIVVGVFGSHVAEGARFV